MEQGGIRMQGQEMNKQGVDSQGIEPRLGVVIVAGGSGKRFGGTTPKQFKILGQKPLLAHTIEAFSRVYPSAEIVVVLAEDRLEYWRNLSARFSLASHRTVSGGIERFDSVKCGLAALSESVDIIAVHDGARPLPSEALLRRCVEGALSSGNAVPVVTVRDSLRILDMDDNGASRVLNRSAVRAVQTPQIFDAILLRKAYQRAYSPIFTDDASVVEALGERIWLVEGESKNIKVTEAEDLALAEYLLSNIVAR